MPLPRPRRAAPRRRRTLLAAVAPALLLVAGCHDAPTGPPAALTALPRALTADEQRTVAAGNDFSLALFRQVNARRAGENVFISPFSAAAALGMLLNGAAGATAEEMRTVLGFTGRTPAEINASYHGLTALLLSLDPAVDVGIANAVFYRQGFAVEPAFLDANRQWFDAEVRALDFANGPATLQAVNGWASAQTRGRIERVLDRVDPGTVMYLMNALYFKGSWRTQFDPARTAPRTFRLAGGATAPVPTMHLPRAELRVGALPDGTELGELPYGNGAFVMTILLPPAGQPVDEAVAALTPERWQAALAALRDVRDGEVLLPKFRLTYEDTWNDVLTAMGMGRIFDAATADLSGISPGGGLFVSFVKQNTFVDVHEAGTEAAAVTTVAVAESLPPGLRVDRAFVFAIRERLSGTILFVGKVAAP